MAKCPIVRPESIRLDLPDGDWIEVKKRLNAGEYRAMVAAQYDTTADRMRINLEQMGLAKILAYTLAWSYVDLQGHALPVTRDTVLAIDPESFRQVLEVVERHDEAVDAELVTEKNAPTGSTPSIPTSH